MARGREYEPASAQSDPAFLERITVDSIRHKQYPEYAEECKRQLRDRSGEVQDATG